METASALGAILSVVPSRLAAAAVLASASRPSGLANVSLSDSPQISSTSPGRMTARRGGGEVIRCGSDDHLLVAPSSSSSLRASVCGPDGRAITVASLTSNASAAPTVEKGRGGRSKSGCVVLPSFSVSPLIRCCACCRWAACGGDGEGLRRRCERGRDDPTDSDSEDEGRLPLAPCHCRDACDFTRPSSTFKSRVAKSVGPSVGLAGPLRELPARLPVRRKERDPSRRMAGRGRACD
jgi:hypothetical protein